jgi:hypothetical protein
MAQVFSKRISLSSVNIIPPHRHFCKEWRADFARDMRDGLLVEKGNAFSCEGFVPETE